MKSVHLMEKILESDFCVTDATSVADSTFGHYLYVSLAMILKQIKFI